MFSAEDVQTSLRDAKAHPCQPNNSGIASHPTDLDGNVVFDNETELEHAEEWTRRKALKQCEEPEPDTDSETFFVQGSGVRKVYSFRPFGRVLSAQPAPIISCTSHNRFASSNGTDTSICLESICVIARSPASTH